MQVKGRWRRHSLISWELFQKLLFTIKTSQKVPSILFLVELSSPKPPFLICIIVGSLSCIFAGPYANKICSFYLACFIHQNVWMYVHVVLCISEWVSEVAQSCPTLCDPWTVAHQAPPSMGLSRQEYWSGLPFPSPGDLPNPGIEPRSPVLEADALTSVHSLVLMSGILLYKYTPFVYPFSCCWTFTLFPVCGSMACWEHFYTALFVDKCFCLYWVNTSEWNSWVIWYIYV